MKQERSRRLRTALFLTAATLLATPVIAQEAQTVTPPAAEQVTPPAAAPTAKPEEAAPATQDSASTTPVNPEAQAQADAEEAERRTEARQAARAKPVRTATRTVARAASTPRTATPAKPEASPTPAPASTAQPSAAASSAPPAVAPAAQPEAASAPTEQAAQPADQTSQTTAAQPGAPTWPLIAIGVLILAGIIGLVAMRRRRAAAHGQWNEPAYIEPAYIEPAYVEPVAAAPIVTPEPRPIASVSEAAIEPAMIAPVDAAVAPAVPEDATVAEPEAADVEALTAATPVADRPWLEFSMRPVRAGANEAEALVEIELTVGNAGSIDAEDVRISTFMFPAGSTSDMERLLVQHQGDGAVAPMTIAAGEGTRIDATLALPRAELIGDGQATGFQPVVVADARYRLPDGSEGRTSASFVVGIASDGDLGVIDLAHPQIREDIEARLYREPARV